MTTPTTQLLMGSYVAARMISRRHWSCSTSVSLTMRSCRQLVLGPSPPWASCNITNRLVFQREGGLDFVLFTVFSFVLFFLTFLFSFLFFSFFFSSVFIFSLPFLFSFYSFLFFCFSFLFFFSFFFFFFSFFFFFFLFFFFVPFSFICFVSLFFFLFFSFLSIFLLFQNTEAAQETIRKALSVLNKALENQTFLVGERVSLADIACVCNLVMLYKQVYLHSYSGFTSCQDMFLLSLFSLLLLLFRFWSQHSESLMYM